MRTIFTCGHSNRAFSEFLKGLQEKEIDVLVDVRTIPRSRFCPQFNQKALSDELGKANITYLFKGSNLGGKGKNTGYEDAVDDLVELIQKGKRVCVMCSEKDYTKCHRHEMLAPSFRARGLLVEHIML